MSHRHTTFAEVMEGTILLAGERHPRPMRLELSARLPEVLRPWGNAEGSLKGRVYVLDWADDDAAAGTLRVAPIAARRIRYTLDFTCTDGRRLHLDGWKSISYGRPVHSMTFLPATVTDESGKVVGEATLRFNLRRDLVSFLSGFRFPASSESGTKPKSPTESKSKSESGLESRWRGQPGRLEVWYTTLTDPATGTGLWLHHELVAPTDGGPAHAHGWAALFPPGGPPTFGRFGPYAWKPSADHLFAAADTVLEHDRLTGSAGDLEWELRQEGGGDTLYTFPRWAWERELLPAAQIVPAPGAHFTGTVRAGDRVLELDRAPGATARIYGHGNAKRWAWLHADLGDGDVCEVVAAVSTRPGLDRLPPLPFVRLRIGDVEIPASPLAPLRLKAELGLPRWSVKGRLSRDQALSIEVVQHPEETVCVHYADPDGAKAICHNSERADATITLLRKRAGRWRPDREWRLDGTAHAEIGLR